MQRPKQLNYVSPCWVKQNHAATDLR